MNKKIMTYLLTGLLSLGALSSTAVWAQNSTPQTQASTITAFNLNTATDDEFLSIPNVGSRMLREFKEYRPYITIDQFKREIGKYVSDDVVNAYLDYVYVPTNPNTASLDQLTALPGVDETMAQIIIDNREYTDWTALINLLNQSYDTNTVNQLEPFWVF